MTQIQPDKGLEWLSVSELSEYLPTHPVEHTIYCWTSNKQIPFHKKGKRIMFLKSEIDEWMQDNNSLCSINKKSHLNNKVTASLTNLPL